MPATPAALDAPEVNLNAVRYSLTEVTTMWRALGHARRRLGASDLQGWPSVTAPIPHHGLGCRCR
ncbi:MAG: hypothetical protein ACREXX_05060 [Gammaproteobacteria bacterium]